MHAQIHSLTFVDECCHLHVEVGNFSGSPRRINRFAEFILSPDLTGTEPWNLKISWALKWCV